MNLTTLVGLFSLIVPRGFQTHFSILPGPHNPSHCSKGLTRSMLHSYIWRHCPHALACPSSCCGLYSARESQAAQRFGSQRGDNIKPVRTVRVVKRLVNAYTWHLHIKFQFKWLNWKMYRTLSQVAILCLPPYLLVLLLWPSQRHNFILTNLTKAF